MLIERHTVLRVRKLNFFPSILVHNASQLLSSCQVCKQAASTNTNWEATVYCCDMQTVSCCAGISKAVLQKDICGWQHMLLENLNVPFSIKNAVTRLSFSSSLKNMNLNIININKKYYFTKNKASILNISSFTDFM